MHAPTYERVAAQSSSKSNKPNPARSKYNIASFNVRGLTQALKRHQLAGDLASRQVDICGLQETKTREFSDEQINDYRLILLPGKCRYYGLGFAINKHWSSRLQSFESIDDRIAVATFKLSARTSLKVINVYAPTQARSNKNTAERDQFYDQLERLLRSIPKRTSFFIVGDFNSKMGQKSIDIKCIGHFGRGRRNVNGQQLVEFSDAHGLTATNTMFMHRASHRTTWQGSRRDLTSGKLVNIYNQIDYIFVPFSQVNLVTNARSYSGTTTNSDHRLVVTTTAILPNYKRAFGNKVQAKQVKYNTHLLSSDEKVRENYALQLDERVANVTTGTTSFDMWCQIRSEIMTTAKETIGTVEKKTRTPHCLVLDQLSAQQKQLRLQAECTPNPETKQLLKKRRNKILVRIKEQIRSLEEREIDKRTSEIERLKDNAQMFAAVRELTSNKPNKLVIKNDKGATVGQPEEAAEIVAKHFASLFYSTTTTPLNSANTAKSLDSPITTAEVAAATAKLSNGRAVGPDGVAGELLKYGGAPLHQRLADIFNKMFERGEQLELGRGTLTVLQKPGKPPGEMKSLRPIVLLNTLRKTLSLIALQRMRPNVEQFLPNSQSGFRPFRSTADAVWAHKWMIARVMKAREEIHVLGEDMSSAFDTVNRSILLTGLENIIDSDCLRMVHTLVDNTTLQARVGRALSEPFTTNIGVPQGDSLSPVLFVIYLELAMRELRTACPRPTSDSSLPSEIIYADDVDIISTSPEYITHTEEQAPPVLGKWDLNINDKKTERITLKREAEQDQESWRKAKKLGTLLGDTEELHRRKQLAAASFHGLERIWCRKKNNKISVDRRLRLYNAYVLPVLTYNSCTWALTQTEQDELDAFHRRQLRKVLGIYHPRKISNEALYARCNTQALRHTIRGARWRMLGHVLRMNEQVPAKFAMKHYFDPSTNSYRGRPRTTLQVVLEKDLEVGANIRADHPLLGIPEQLRSREDLEQLERTAQTRPDWRRIVAYMQVPPPPKPRKLMPRRHE